MERDLRAAGVPQEAFPQRLPQIYEAYTVRSPGPAHARIEVLLRVEEFLVPRPRGLNRSLLFPWRGNAAQAWEAAKLRAGW